MIHLYRNKDLELKNQCNNLILNEKKKKKTT